RIQNLTHERNLVGIHLGLHSQVDAIGADSIKQLARDRCSRPDPGSDWVAGTVEQQTRERSLGRNVNRTQTLNCANGALRRLISLFTCRCFANSHPCAEDPGAWFATALEVSLHGRFLV